MLIFVCLLQLIIVLFYFNSKNTTAEIVVKSALIFSAFIVVLVETLSLFKALTLTSLIISWSLFSVSLFFILFKKRKELTVLIAQRKKHLHQKYKYLTLYEKALLWVITAFALLLLFQGIIYPPNNWDSLTYHMSRIMHWIGNESVAHYPTPVLRHLYQPPFLEYLILNLNLLNGNDYLSNSVQLLFLTLSIAVIWEVLSFFKTSRFLKILAAFLLITIPSAELQASTTKNDIVCGFFLLTVLCFAIKTYYDSTLKNYLFLALAIGLGFFTKGTSYLFIAPILVFFGVFMVKKAITTKNYRIITYGFLLIFTVILINTGHYYRNYQINKDILNIDNVESKMFSNADMNAALLVSNLIKNTGLHLGYPIFGKSDALIRLFHTKAGVDINNPDTNYTRMAYQVSQELITHEDGVCNTTHFLLICMALAAFVYLFVFKPKQNGKLMLLVLILLLQAIIFAGYLKWQPWHTRLHIPLFMLSVIIMAIVAEKLKLFRYVLLASIPFLLFSFYFYFAYNNIRPIITNYKLTKYIKISDSRFEKYFSNQPQLYEDYSRVLNAMYSNNPTKVGLSISDWEYPLFHECYYNKINLVSLNVENVTNVLPQNTENIDAIISTHGKSAFIEFEGKTYENQTPNNEYIWYYK